MGWEQTLIKGLQSLSNAFFDAVNLGITFLGDEIFFIVVAVVLYWCVDKKFAYKFMNVYILSVAANEGLKSIVARRRPYLVEGIRSIGKETGGYSFPSGHSQSIANISTQINMRWREGVPRKVFLPVGIVVTALVMFSRMYLGQHYLTDVIVGAALGIVLALLLGTLFDFLGNKEEWIAAGIIPLCLVLAVVFSVIGIEGVGNVMTVLGAYTAIAIGYFCEKKFVGYNVRSNKWWKYGVKLIIGLAATLALKEGLKFAFDPDVYLLYNFLRYFIVGLWASLCCPLIFRLCRL